MPVFNEKAAAEQADVLHRFRPSANNGALDVNVDLYTRLLNGLRLVLNVDRDLVIVLDKPFSAEKLLLSVDQLLRSSVSTP